MRLHVCLLATSMLSCLRDPDPSTVEGAFERMAEAAEAGSIPDLFAALDDQSRGSVSAIRSAQRQAQALVDRDYPQSERARATGRWRLGADARDASGVFSAWCSDVACLAEVRDRLSAPTRTTERGSRAEVTVRRGRSYPFLRSKRGWGLSLFEERLRRWKVEVFRDLESIRESARIYREAG